MCRTCYAANYIMRDNVSARDEWLCLFNRCRYRAVAQYEFNLITRNDFSFKTEIEKYRMFKKIKAIRKLLPSFEKIEEDLRW